VFIREHLSGHRKLAVCWRENLYSASLPLSCQIIFDQTSTRPSESVETDMIKLTPSVETP
ncbi:hypothetical protein, partial [Halomonas llamarensis]